MGSFRDLEAGGKSEGGTYRKMEKAPAVIQAPKGRAGSGRRKTYKATLPGGEVVYVEADNPEQAKATAEAKRYVASTPSPVRVFNQGGAFGFADELNALGAAGTTAVNNALAKIGVTNGAGYTSRQAYDAVMSEEQRQNDAFRRERPVSSVALEVGGAVANPLARAGGGFISQGSTGVAKIARAGGVNALMGGVYGAGAAEQGERAKGAATGAAVGFGTGGAMQAAGNALARGATQAAVRQAPARQLARQGVRLTPGQMLGGTAQRLEDASTSVPVLGDAIRSARKAGLESFDRAAINRVLAPIGQALPDNVDMGRDAVRLAHKAVSDAYDNALGAVTVAPDTQFTQELQQIRQATVQGAARDELAAAVQRIEDAFQEPISGRDLKALDEELGLAIRSTPNSPTGRALRDALGRLQDSLDGALGRADPNALAAKNAADEAYANLVRVEGAAGMSGARGGVFGPAQLQNAVRSAEGGARKSRFARGEALMQDLTDPAMEVLPQTVPDSGTALRSLVTVGGLGGGGVAVGANPAVVGGSAAALGAGALLYSRPVLDALNAVYRASTPGQAQAALSTLAEMAAREPALQGLYNAVRAQVLDQSDARPRSPQSQPSPMTR